MSHTKFASKFAAISLATVALALAAPHSAGAQDIYKWTDENGVVHFSDIKPPDTETQGLTVDKKSGFNRAARASDEERTAEPAADTAAAEPELTAARQRRKEMAEAREAARLAEAETQLGCDRHHKRLTEMEPARRVYTYDENGRQVRMDDDTRVALIEESRNYIAENCQ